MRLEPNGHWPYDNLAAAHLGLNRLVALKMPRAGVDADPGELIDRAAQSQGKSRTDFMLEAACEKAQQVLLDQTTFQLEQRRFKQFLKLIDKPPGTVAGEGQPR